ncbi:carboxymuconolactone decarboxylase family protein [Halomonas getboli]|uniref:carboxymuconolactone decarboxylase family protein n=1 Tax=Halomonas getboli TaxID=2935862 RepID=UPI001FFE5AC1|nr:carboxymuconolactone decarboxylase family protein [Halomonas getboli]MCK2184111.1 carboxymuconolactone decarboxylase family protein [Halomonas getboli]
MSDAPTTRRDEAFALLARLEPEAPARVARNLDDFDADAAEILLGFAFADVVARDGLDLRTREMLTVAMLGAMGTAQGQLEFHLRAALNTGVTREQVVEIVLQVAVYAGIPAAMNAMNAAKAAFRTQEVG